MTPLFHYKSKLSTIPLDGRTKAFFGLFVIGGLCVSLYSLYQLVVTSSLIYLGSFIISLLIASGYGVLWKTLKNYRVHPTLMEVYPSHFYLKKYNDEAKMYNEWKIPLSEIQIIVERHLEPSRGTIYMTPVIHLYQTDLKRSMELFFDEDATINQFLLAVKEGKGVIRYLPMSLDFCSRTERIQAFEEESEIISFSGDVSDYVKRNQEAFFYSERMEYKDVLIKKQNKDHDAFC